MKKIIGILGIAVITVMMIFNINTINDSTSDTSLASLMSMNVAHADGEGGTKPTCAAGGCNASSCSFSGEISVMGSGTTVSCSVSCDSSTWACCHLTAYCFSKTKC
ncbi:hypothetical protein [Flavobacterium daejeonense]|uniref:hypothetical protein n=1 Tax=Flavobacterium daejeonense TaxID=350893 RepID=UPI0005543279|nr:hypothetical protein [Flavobacterium daejeonense]